MKIEKTLLDMKSIQIIEGQVTGSPDMEHNTLNIVLLDLGGTIFDMPIRYLCNQEEAELGPASAFDTADRVLVEWLTEIDGVTGDLLPPDVNNCTVIGFSNGLKRSCRHRVVAICGRSHVVFYDCTLNQCYVPPAYLESLVTQEWSGTEAGSGNAWKYFEVGIANLSTFVSDVLGDTAVYAGYAERVYDAIYATLESSDMTNLPYIIYNPYDDTQCDQDDFEEGPGPCQRIHLTAPAASAHSVRLRQKAGLDCLSECFYSDDELGQDFWGAFWYKYYDEADRTLNLEIYVGTYSLKDSFGVNLLPSDWTVTEYDRTRTITGLSTVHTRWGAHIYRTYNHTVASESGVTCAIPEPSDFYTPPALDRYTPPNRDLTSYNQVGGSGQAYDWTINNSINLAGRDGNWDTFSRAGVYDSQGELTLPSWYTDLTTYETPSEIPLILANSYRAREIRKTQRSLLYVYSRAETLQTWNPEYIDPACGSMSFPVIQEYRASIFMQMAGGSTFAHISGTTGPFPPDANGNGPHRTETWTWTNPPSSRIKIELEGIGKQYKKETWRTIFESETTNHEYETNLLHQKVEAHREVRYAGEYNKVVTWHWNNFNSILAGSVQTPAYETTISEDFIDEEVKHNTRGGCYTEIGGLCTDNELLLLEIGFNDPVEEFEDEGDPPLLDTVIESVYIYSTYRLPSQLSAWNWAAYRLIRNTSPWIKTFYNLCQTESSPLLTLKYQFVTF